MVVVVIGKRRIEHLGEADFTSSFPNILGKSRRKKEGKKRYV